MTTHDKIYIDGAWVPSTGTGSIDVYDSTDGSVIGQIPDGTAEDVDKAAKAARRRVHRVGGPRPRGARQVHGPHRRRARRPHGRDRDDRHAAKRACRSG